MAGAKTREEAFEDRGGPEDLGGAFHPKISDRVSDIEGRLDALARRRAPASARPREILSRTFEELEITLQQLRVAEEQLRQLSVSLADARAAAERERRRYAELFQLVAEAYLVTTLDGAIQEANPAACALFGQPARVLSRRHLRDFLDEGEHFPADEIPCALGTRMRLRPGREAAVATLAAVLRDREGQPAGLCWRVCGAGSAGATPAEAARLRLLVSEHERREMRLRSDWEHEHRIAETLQTTLLPAVAPDAFPGLSVATLYQAALEEARVGGDFYDAFPAAGGRIALAVGDASGKGLRAAACAAEVRFALRAFLHEYPDPADAIRRLNDFVCDTRGLGWDRDASSFLVLSLAVVDPGSGDAVVVRAGSEPPLVVRADGACESVEAGGTVLGYETGKDYAAAALRLLPGDTLMLATDGITEARRGPGDFLGYEGMTALARAAARQAPGDPGAMGRAILAGARDFGGGSLRDDACLLLTQRRDRSDERI